MFGQLLDKSKEIMSIDKDTVLKGKILSGQLGDEIKSSLNRWIEQTIYNTIEKAKIEAIDMIHSPSLSNFDELYCTLRNLGATYSQLSAAKYEL